MNTETQNQNGPVGEARLLLRTLAMPGDTNPAGDIFGGWIMSQMDIAGSLMAREVANGRVVTVAVDGMSFLKPVKVGDVVCCYGRFSKIGRTSVTVALELWVKKHIDDDEGQRVEKFMVTKAHYTYVHVTRDGKPCPLPEHAKAQALRGIIDDCAADEHD